MIIAHTVADAPHQRRLAYSALSHDRDFDVVKRHLRLRLQRVGGLACVQRRQIESITRHVEHTQFRDGAQHL